MSSRPPAVGSYSAVAPRRVSSVPIPRRSIGVVDWNDDSSFEAQADAVPRSGPPVPDSVQTVAIPPSAPLPTSVDAPRRDDVLVERVAAATTDPRLILVNDADSERAAAFRVLAQRLSKRRAVRSLLVSSAEPGEGKTTCAINLALALAECDRARVALLEANLRTPVMAKLMGFEPQACFVQQVVAHRVDAHAPWHLAEVYLSGLHVGAVASSTPKGPMVDAVALALAVERIQQSGYDYVIIDSPSVLHQADVNVIQEAVDGVFLAARAGASRGKDVRKAVEQLGPEKLLGVVLVDG